jgi:hypothetical protein
MIGLTTDDRERSRAYLGNRKRFATFTEKLQNREQVIVVVNGGSVTLGNGVDPKTLWYSDQLEVWLNEMYPVDSDHRHRVFKMGSHGADDVCMTREHQTCHVMILLWFIILLAVSKLTLSILKCVKWRSI